MRDVPEQAAGGSASHGQEPSPSYNHHPSSIIIMNEEIAIRRNNRHIQRQFGTDFHIKLSTLYRNEDLLTIDQLMLALEATTTATHLYFSFHNYNATPENIRHAVEPLCRCIATLRRHNPNHPLRSFAFFYAKNVHHEVVDQLLLAAKQYGIHSVVFIKSRLPIQSLVQFCRDNTHLQRLSIYVTAFFDKDSMISASPQPQDSSAILALRDLNLESAILENATTATKFLNLMAHLTYPALRLGNITVGGDENDQEKKIARLHIVSELLTPSVEQLTLGFCCQIEVMDVIEECATIAQIHLKEPLPPIHFRNAAVKQKLQAIAVRNRELARFVPNPQAYSRDDLLGLMRQFDGCPTGRYMLACSAVGMPSFFKI